MPAYREYTIYVRLPYPVSQDREDEYVLRICDAFEQAGFDGDEYQFGDTTDLDEDGRPL